MVPRQLQRANLPGVQGLAAMESRAPLGTGMSTYSWFCHPAAGGGEEPLAWPAHPRENQFLPPSWEQRSVLWENGCETGTVGCRCVPTPRVRPVPPRRGSCPRVVFSLRPLRCSSLKAGTYGCPCCFWWDFHPTNAGGSGETAPALVPEAAGPTDSVREGRVPAPSVQDLPCVLAPGVTQQLGVRRDGSWTRTDTPQLPRFLRGEG